MLAKRTWNDRKMKLAERSAFIVACHGEKKDVANTKREVSLHSQLYEDWKQRRGRRNHTEWIDRSTRRVRIFST